MERKSYIEFRRYTPIEPSKLYYVILYGAVIFAVIFSVFFVELIQILFNCDSESTWINSLIFLLVFYLYIAYRTTRERVLVHDNGTLEIYQTYKHYTIPISSIEQINYKKQFSIYYSDIIILILETTQNKKIKLMLKETKEFLAELKKHNPDIIIPELPEI